ncbi:metallophosphoesterase family protein [Methylocapsa palsarum]|uniref:DNA repair exonuclease SbcCD nuclease subunit n=1 Tax=Methylocapsa palsarum TaxID=1612308 RepID=A0A1I3WT07_9HYPH|nr:DNA repair exonuclease [Methylocapsa palsarum]SFK10645.1 DNA repair exonuclease SbcCD nuclease subunit [Methylocapsa palsarum]
MQMRFTFIHAADLHVGSPLAALGVKDPAIAERFAHAGRRALDRLIDETIAARAAFLLISGDIFDGDWTDVSTGHFFVRALGRLDREGIRTFIVKGNHDAVSLMSRSLPYPQSVTVFPHEEALSIELAELGAVLHGRSFGERTVAADFVASYPARREGALNIGLLHTSLEAVKGASSYAPCTADDLRRFGYDYWALGHIHTAEIVHRNPWIVYPGNIQGRSVREPGAKGAMRVSVEGGAIASVEPIILDSARWAHERVDLAGCDDETELHRRVGACLDRLSPQIAGLPSAVRLTLTGTTRLHARLAARREEIEADVRAIAFRFADDCWVERVILETVAPEKAGGPRQESDAIDVEALLAAAAQDPEFRASAHELLGAILAKLPQDLKERLPFKETSLDRLAELAHDQMTGSLFTESEP